MTTRGCIRRNVAQALVLLGGLHVSSMSVGCTGEITRSGSPGSAASSKPSSTPSSTPSSNPSSNPSEDPNSSPTSNPNDAKDAAVDTSQCRPPPSRIVRLSKLEIQNSVADLLATTRSVDLADDAKFLNFSSNAAALYTSPFANALKSTAEMLAADFRAAWSLPSSAAVARTAMTTRAHARRRSSTPTARTRFGARSSRKRSTACSRCTTQAARPVPTETSSIVSRRGSTTRCAPSCSRLNSSTASSSAIRTPSSPASPS